MSSSMQLPYRFGRYTLLQRLAAGGMGEVYRACYEGEGGFSKIVAIKRILPSHMDDAHLTSMFLDEARVLTYLQHQNIVQVFELGKDEERFFISMEYVDGIDLRRLFLHLRRRELELPRRFLLHIVAQLLQGLDFVHRCRGPDGQLLRLIHRDVSPANVLISWNGEVKITDFGIAKGFHRTEETTVVQLKGKFAYMSPEQARGQPLDQRSDIFSVGVILYELLTRQRLFEGTNDLEVLEKVKIADIPAEPLKDIPPELQAVLYLALSVDCERRYPSASSFLQDLQRYVHDSGDIASGFELGHVLRECLSHPVPPPSSGEAVASQGAEAIRTRFITGRQPALGFFRGVVHAAVSLILAVGAGISMTSHGMVIRTPPPVQGPERTVSLALIPQAVTVAVTPVATKPLKNASMSIQARPWGVVTIPGYFTDRETPVNGARVKAGPLLVSVVHPPSGRKIAQKVTLEEGSHATCIADFTHEPQIDCR